ncbi:type IIL restriction-modification enzyme MmeI [Methylomonas sp. MgM2]
MEQNQINNNNKTMTATLNINTIRKRAAEFAKEYADKTYESGFDQKFVNHLCRVFGISDYRLVDFQTRVKKIGNKSGRIDAFLPGKLLVEMKSANENLDKAYVQATEYLPGLKDEELPRYILVSDFANLHLYDRQTKAPRLEIKLADFPQNIEPFLFLAELYDPLAMPPELLKAHAELDKAVDAAYGYKGKKDDAARVAFLFGLYQKLSV